MNRLSIVNFALRAVGEQTSPAHFGGTTPVIAWLNEAKREFETETRINFGTAPSVTATAGNRLLSIATAMFHPAYVRYRGEYLQKTDRNELIDDDSSNAFLTDKGTPSHWYNGEGFNQVGLYPMPTGGYGGTLVAEGYKISAALANDTSVPVFNPQFHWALVNRLIMRFCEEDADSSRNQLAWQRAAGEYRKFVALVSRERERGRFVIHSSWNS